MLPETLADSSEGCCLVSHHASGFLGVLQCLNCNIVERLCNL